MARYKNDALLKLIGKCIRDYRLKSELEIEDVAEMAGLSFNTITNIENGEETYVTNFLEVCMAIGMHPRDILAFEINIKPRFELSASRKEKSRLTARIRKFIDTGFFVTPKSTNEVVEKLKEEYHFDASSKNVSSILKRHLKANKKGNLNYYSND